MYIRTHIYIYIYIERERYTHTHTYTLSFPRHSFAEKKAMLIRMPFQGKQTREVTSYDDTIITIIIISIMCIYIYIYIYI